MKTASQFTFKSSLKTAIEMNELQANRQTHQHIEFFNLTSFAFICPFVVLDPADLGATIVVAPGQMPGGILPSPDADCLPFLVKLVP